MRWWVCTPAPPSWWAGIAQPGYQHPGGGGCLLFHILFTVSQDAGKNLFGNANIGEFFRVFIAYGVIAVALVMHTWRSNQASKKSALQT